MGQFVRGSTDTIIGKIKGDISGSTNIELWINTFNEIFKHNKEELLFISVVDGYTFVGYKLTQIESLSCCEDYISVQVRWTDANGSVSATKRKLMAVDSAEWDSVIPRTPSEDTDTTICNVGRILENEISNMIRTEG